MQSVWGDIAVTDESITKCVADIRKDQVLELSTQIHAAARKRAAEQVPGSDASGGTDPARTESAGPAPAIGAERRSPAGASASRDSSDKPSAVKVISAERRPDSR